MQAVYGNKRSLPTLCQYQLGPEHIVHFDGCGDFATTDSKGRQPRLASTNASILGPCLIILHNVDNNAFEYFRT